MEPVAMKLVVACDRFEFAKPFRYFFTVSIGSGNEVRRSDISEETDMPVFEENMFEFEVGEEDMSSKVVIKVYLAISLDGKNEARLLGDASVELEELRDRLDRNQEIREEMDVLRNSQGNIIVVGKFYINISLEKQYPEIHPETTISPHRITTPQYKPNTPQDTSILEDNDEFAWRVRLDARFAIDVNSSTSDRLPSPYIEFGWSQYSEQLPPDNEKVRTKVVSLNRHPIWNQQILYTNPSTINDYSGFFWILLRDKEDGTILERIKLLTHAMRPFHPLHLSIKSSKGNESLHDLCNLYFSIVIEENIRASFIDHLVEIRIKSVHWHPLPKTLSKMMIGMSTSHYAIKPPLFSTVDMKGETNLLREMVMHKDRPESVYLSNIMPISAKQASAYASCLFVVPLSYLDSSVSFYVIVRDDEEDIRGIPSSVIAYTEVLDRDLQECL